MELKNGGIVANHDDEGLAIILHDILHRQQERSDIFVALDQLLQLQPVSPFHL